MWQRERDSSDRGEWEREWERSAICSLKQTCAKKELNLTHFICKYRKYNITHATRRETLEDTYIGGQLSLVTGRWWLVAGPRIVVRCPIKASKLLQHASGNQTGGFEPGHNNRL